MSGWPPSKKSAQEIAADVVSWPCKWHVIVNYNISPLDCTIYSFLFVEYIMMLSLLRLYGVVLRKDWRSAKGFEGSGRDLHEDPRICWWGRETTKNLRIVSVPVEIQTEHLPKTSLACYLYINLLGNFCFYDEFICCPYLSGYGLWNTFLFYKIYVLQIFGRISEYGDR